MDNFARAIRVTLQFRSTIVAAVITALLTAVLWGGNITAVYPLFEVSMKGMTLSQWVTGKIDEAESRAAEKQIEAASLKARAEQATGADQSALLAQVSALEQQISTEQTAAVRYRWMQGPIERYLPNDPFQTLLCVVAALMIGTIIKDFFIACNEICVSRLTQLTMFRIRSQFYRNVLRMDLARFQQTGSGELLSRYSNDLDAVGAGVQTLCGRAIMEPLKAIVCLAIAAYVSWQLLVLSLVTVPLAGYLIARLAKLLKRANRKALEVLANLYQELIETFGGIKVIKAFATESHQRQRFHQQSKQCYKKMMRIAMLDALVSPLTEIMGIATISLAIILGAYLALNRQTHLWFIRISNRPLNLGELMVFYGMLAGLTDPARKLSEVFNRLQRAVAASDRVFGVLDIQPTIVEPAQPKPLARHKQDIRFEGISFGYTPEQPVLQDVDLQIAYGETIAILGPNGCGKSTLVNLLPRFYDPLAGTIRIDGVEIRELRLKDLRRQIGVVSQDTVLFNDTIYNNIRYGSPWATRDEIVRAAQKAHAHEFIEQKLEQGYETLCGQGGGRLSGGQRQRIALARAILRDPAILILDEATSQIDIESEQLIHQALAEFVRDRTAIMITHRLSTLELADRIVVMENGTIRDVGTHHQLLAQCDLYRRLRSGELRSAA